MTIEILLSTFNGAKYLARQLDSIIAQENKQWNIIARDDGSSDETYEILTEYADKIGRDRFLLLEGRDNIGVVKSFSLLVSFSSAPVVMFCDQDDFWLPTKIDKTLALMTSNKDWEKVPTLVHSDLIVADKDLKEIDSSFIKYSKIDTSTEREKLALQNCVTGCTMMLNRAALDVCAPFPSEARMHDSWCALCVSKAGGRILFIDEPTMLYRQHQGNALGAVKREKLWLLDKIKKIKEVYKKNKKQWAMLKKINYCTLFEYLKWKVLCFFCTN